MLKFGKKVSYRPLFFSLCLGLGMGLLFGSNIDWNLGLNVGIIMFLVTLLGHYLLILPIIYSYWDITDHWIRYSDTKKLYRRIFALLLPTFFPLTVIKRTTIATITVVGLPSQRTNITTELVISEEGGFMYNLLFMINNPVLIRLTLLDGQIINLNISRDYVTHPYETIGKLTILLREFDAEKVNLTEETQKIIKLN